MSADLEDPKREKIDELQRQVEALEALVEAQGRQLSVIRTTIAGGDEEFWDLPRDGEGHNLVGRLEQYEAALNGFAERLREIQEGNK